mmetsp:Transcript_26069/g.80550  ORF Transcript_26069/g.80550 Transcript_26069/m.80550 type:complete len:242 (+) Transcript_26069:206-931(+)
MALKESRRCVRQGQRDRSGRRFVVVRCSVTGVDVARGVVIGCRGGNTGSVAARGLWRRRASGSVRASDDAGAGSTHRFRRCVVLRCRRGVSHLRRGVAVFELDVAGWEEPCGELADTLRLGRRHGPAVGVEAGLVEDQAGALRIASRHDDHDLEALGAVVARVTVGIVDALEQGRDHVRRAVEHVAKSQFTVVIAVEQGEQETRSSRPDNRRDGRVQVLENPGAYDRPLDCFARVAQLSER